MMNLDLYVSDDQIKEITSGIKLEDSKVLISAENSLMIFFRTDKQKALKISESDNIFVVPYFLKLVNCIAMNVAFFNLQCENVSADSNMKYESMESEFVENGVTSLIPLGDMCFTDALIKISEGRAKMMLYAVSEDLQFIAKRAILQSEYGKGALIRELKKANII
jgi:hypothetical protein